MKPEHITDDLNKLIEILPAGIQAELNSNQRRNELIEVVLDLGRVPEARYPKKVISLGQENLSKIDLHKTVKIIGGFGPDNRAGIEKTLHRIIYWHMTYSLTHRRHFRESIRIAVGLFGHIHCAN